MIMSIPTANCPQHSPWTRTASASPQGFTRLFLIQSVTTPCKENSTKQIRLNKNGKILASDSIPLYYFLNLYGRIIIDYPNQILAYYKGKTLLPQYNFRSVLPIREH